MIEFTNDKDETFLGFVVNDSEFDKGGMVLLKAESKSGESISIIFDVDGDSGHTSTKLAYTLADLVNIALNIENILVAAAVEAVGGGLDLDADDWYLQNGDIEIDSGVLYPAQYGTPEIKVVHQMSVRFHLKHIREAAFLVKSLAVNTMIKACEMYPADMAGEVLSGILQVEGFTSKLAEDDADLLRAALARTTV